MSEYIAKASIEPRDYRVVFLIQKKKRNDRSFYTMCKDGYRYLYISTRLYFDSSIILLPLSPGFW